MSPPKRSFPGTGSLPPTDALSYPDENYRDSDYDGGSSAHEAPLGSSEPAPYDSLEDMAHRATEFAARANVGLRLGPSEEIPRMPTPDEVAELRRTLERLKQERSDAVAALEHERQQRDERLNLLTEEQDRFVARMLREHEEEIFLLSRESRRYREDFRRTQQDLGKARRDIGRLRGELESAQDELTIAREELDLERRRAKSAQPRAEIPLASEQRLRPDVDRDAEIERLLVEYSRAVEQPQHSRSATVAQQYRNSTQRCAAHVEEKAKKVGPK